MPAPIAYSILIKKENAHKDPIYSCAWATIKPTGDSTDVPKDVVVTGGLDGLVNVWQFQNNKLEPYHVLKGHTMAVVCVAISPDGHTLATTSLDCTLIIWDMLAGQKVHELQTEDLWRVAFSPDCGHIVSGSHAGMLNVYSVEQGTPEWTLDTRGQFTLSVAWSPDGKYIASGAVDGVACIFDVAQAKLVHTIAAHTTCIRSIAFSPNSQQIVTASDDGDVKIFNVESAGLQSTLEHKSWATSARFSPDGGCVATAAADGGVRVASADGLKLLHCFQEHTAAVWGVQFNSESNKLLSVSKDKCINIYECPVMPKHTKK